MINKKRLLFLICPAQILGVLLWLGCIRAFVHANTPMDRYLYLGVPIVLSSAVGFTASILLPVKVNFIKGFLCSVPTACIYFLVYIFIPFTSIANLVPGNLSEEIGFFLVACLILYLPFTILVLALNTLSVWLGSLLHSRFFKPKDERAG